MASEQLSWTFELQDRLTGNASKAAAAMGKLESNIGHAGGALHRFHDLVELAYEGPKILAEVWEWASEKISDVLDEMQFKSSSLLALTALMGSADQAKEVFEGVEEFAYKTGQSVRSVMTLTKDLVASGFGASDVERLRNTLGDLRVVDPSKADAVGVALGEIGRRGYMAERQMRSLSNAGVDETKMWQYLSDTLHVSIARLKAIPELKIAAGTAATMVEKILADKLAGGIPGALMRENNKTLPSLLQRVHQIPELVWSQLMGLDDPGHANSPLAGFLTNLLDTFDPQGQSGKLIIGKLREFMALLVDTLGGHSGLFDELAGPNGAEKIKRAMVDLVEWMKTDLIPAIHVVKDLVVDTVEALAKVAHFYGAMKENTIGQGILRSIPGVNIPYLLGDLGTMSSGPGAPGVAVPPVPAPQPWDAEWEREMAKGDAARRGAPTAGATINVNVHGAKTEEDGRRVGRAAAREMEHLGIGQGGR